MKGFKLIALVMVILLTFSMTSGVAFAADAPKIKIALLLPGSLNDGGWNANAYQQIERLIPLLRIDARSYYRAVVGMYVYPRFVRRAVCPRCNAVQPPGFVGELHSHTGRKSAAFVARMVRVPLYPVEQADVDGAIGWLDDHWHGGVFVPDELLPLATAA
jgi:hypothetical protein